MTTDNQRVHALAGMLAAVEYCRIQFTAMATQSQLPPGETMLGQLAADQAALAAIEADCAKPDPPLDLLGALAAITLRAASLAAAVIDGMTVPKFLDLLEAETRGWKPE